MQIAPPPSDKSRLSEFSQSLTAQFGRCLAPGTLCDEPPIRAHAVQNSRVLETLQSNNHVMMMKLGISGGALSGGLQKTSRNEATTFRGLCSTHDRTLFERIDVGALDVDDPEVRILLSWRAITHELHQNIEAAGRIQSAYRKMVDAGELDGNVPSPAGMEATAWMMTAYETFRYRSTYWDAELSNFSEDHVHFDVFQLRDVPPVLAASGLFSFQPKANSTARRIALNIWPNECGDTVALFGYSDDDRFQAKTFIRKLQNSSGKIHPAKLSAALLQHLGNFVLCPKHVEKWSNEKKHAVEKAYHNSTLNSHHVPPSRMHNLFVA